MAGEKKKGRSPMKKTTKLLTLFVSLCLLCSLLVACDKSSAVADAFREEGYTVSSVNTENDDVRAIFTLLGLDEEEIEELQEYELIFCKKGITGITGSALIVKFPSAGELRDELSDDDDRTEYEKAKEEGRIRGNCLLLYGSTEIFGK